MKIFIANPEPNDLKVAVNILLSFYDIYISALPFRKKTFKILKDENIHSQPGT